jgi:hypothetical protein
MSPDDWPALTAISHQGLLVCISTREIFGIAYLCTEQDFKKHLDFHCRRHGRDHLDRIYVTFPGDEFWDILHSDDTCFWPSGEQVGPWRPVDMNPETHRTHGDLSERISQAMRAKSRKILLPSQGRIHAPARSLGQKSQ